ncbi:MAG: VacJ family lipoprotein [Nitrospirales bacterium]|nr:VacJ family lipoprotein [Nitrospirales bacterium]MBA3965633.1 VacJ family lipoprotein [Nitrospirales bacterium]
MPQQTEDFGQTLGHYGLNAGAYLMLSILGPPSMKHRRATDRFHCQVFLFVHSIAFQSSPRTQIPL